MFFTVIVATNRLHNGSGLEPLWNEPCELSRKTIFSIYHPRPSQSAAGHIVTAHVPCTPPPFDFYYQAFITNRNCTSATEVIHISGRIGRAYSLAIWSVEV